MVGDSAIERNDVRQSQASISSDPVFGAAMGLVSRVKRAIGGGTDTQRIREEMEEQFPNHICKSCGEKYYTNPETEIEKCRQCNGIRVESIRS